MGEAVVSLQDKASTVGSGDVISCIELGVVQLNVGEHAVVWASSKFAFDEMGVKDFRRGEQRVLVEGGKPVVLEIELLSVEWYVMSTNDVDKKVYMSLEERMDVARRAHANGNERFRHRAWKKASAEYRKGIYVLSFPEPKGDAACRKLSEMMLCNIAQINLEQKDYVKAEKTCLEVLDLNRDNVKALFRLAKARMSMKGRSQEAWDDILKAELLDPTNTKIRQLKEQIAKKLKEEAPKKAFWGKLA